MSDKTGTKLQMAAEEAAWRDAVGKLSPADQLKAIMDTKIFGSAWVRINTDGAAELLNVLDVIDKPAS